MLVVVGQQGKTQGSMRVRNKDRGSLCAAAQIRCKVCEDGDSWSVVLQLRTITVDIAARYTLAEKWMLRRIVMLQHRTNVLGLRVLKKCACVAHVSPARKAALAPWLPTHSTQVSGVTGDPYQRRVQARCGSRQLGGFGDSGGNNTCKDARLTQTECAWVGSASHGLALQPLVHTQCPHDALPMLLLR